MDLVPAYVKLLRDNEAEVRIAAAGKVTKFCQILDPKHAIEHILPCVKVKDVKKDFETLSDPCYLILSLFCSRQYFHLYFILYS